MPTSMDFLTIAAATFASPPVFVPPNFAPQAPRERSPLVGPPRVRAASDIWPPGRSASWIGYYTEVRYFPEDIHGQKVTVAADPHAAILGPLPKWFQGVNLQQYATAFEGVSWGEILYMDEDDLRRAGVLDDTAVARMLKLLGRVRKRIGLPEPAHGFTPITPAAPAAHILPPPPPSIGGVHSAYLSTRKSKKRKGSKISKEPAHSHAAGSSTSTSP
ncbi:hypothetical protein BOTBODRAFT_182271 [Botryobasidium botryosum FD-172 SS1]|uniref:SAM domain-containing protein n=1 Tax=Botryobasidium botryosum (strain FD-172 SS1) TaxID=930990 RepID=A0A067M1J4_BOTB1|nr:hypothetical protein BOTBODRAFT_182271 [Botryobasidium botryosum FD-172 SS1]